MPSITKSEAYGTFLNLQFSPPKWMELAGSKKVTYVHGTLVAIGQFNNLLTNQNIQNKTATIF